MMKRIAAVLLLAASTAFGAYQDNGAAGEYATAGSTEITAYPFSMSCWFRPRASANVQSVQQLSDKDTNLDYFGWVWDGGATKARTSARGGGSEAFAFTSNTGTAGQWNHILAVFTNATSRTVYLNGDVTNKGVDTTSITVGALDSTTLGRLQRSTPCCGMEGTLSDCMFWNVALGDNDAVSMGIGRRRARCIRPEAQRMAYPLLFDPDLTQSFARSGASGILDVAGGTKTHLTANGGFQNNPENDPVLVDCWQ